MRLFVDTRLLYHTYKIAMVGVVHVSREAVSVVMQRAVQLGVWRQDTRFQHVAERVDVQCLRSPITLQKN